MRQDVPRAQEHSLEIYADNPLPLSHRKLLAVAEGEDAGVVDQDVDAAELPCRRGHQLQDLLIRRYIGLDKQAPGAQLLHLFHGRGSGVLLVIPAAFGSFLNVGDDDVRSFAGKLDADTPPDP